MTSKLVTFALSLGLAMVLVSLGGKDAAAYPMFQLARDQTCTNCHLSPSGGGTLNENGENVAEGISQLGTNPEFMYGKLGTPNWLKLGGDARALGGFFATPFKTASAFPMQLEIYASAILPGGFTIHANVGIRPPETGNEVATAVWTREHYVMWQSNPDEPGGLFIRAGHFEPVFGLRFAEHEDYTRRFGGTALDTETYGVAAEYIDPRWEVHATGFIKDPVIDPASQDSGVALYAEARPTTSVSFGLEGMATASKDDYKQRVGVTNKVLLPGDVLVQTEVIVTRQDIRYPVNDTAAPNGYSIRSNIVPSIAGYLVASRFLNDWLMLDVGIGHYDENASFKGLDRDALDVNLHWFTTSHVELVLNTRLEMFDWTLGGNTGGYAALQAHYRL